MKPFWQNTFLNDAIRIIKTQFIDRLSFVTLFYKKTWIPSRLLVKTYYPILEFNGWIVCFVPCRLKKLLGAPFGNIFLRSCPFLTMTRKRVWSPYSSAKMQLLIVTPCEAMSLSETVPNPTTRLHSNRMLVKTKLDVYRLRSWTVRFPNRSPMWWTGENQTA